MALFLSLLGDSLSLLACQHLPRINQCRCSIHSLSFLKSVFPLPPDTLWSIDCKLFFLIGSDGAKKCIGQAIQKDVSDEWGKVLASGFSLSICFSCQVIYLPFKSKTRDAYLSLYIYIIHYLINFFSFYQVKLHFTEKALRLIARKAITKNTGARGLRAILENLLMEAMYEVYLFLPSFPHSVLPLYLPLLCLAMT